MYLKALFLILFIGYTTQAWECPTSTNVITLSDIQHAAETSKYVYNDRLFQQPSIPKTNFKIIKVFHKEMSKNSEGIRVIIADYGNTRTVAYRGTDGIEQLLSQGSDTIFGKKQTLIFPNQRGSDTVEVLKYFHEAFELLFYSVRPYLRDSSKKYILTGHSLGGALASLLAVRMTQYYGGSVWKNPKSCLITFGQPRVGNKAYADVHDRLISTWRKLRFVYKYDPVTALPLYNVFNKKGWTHHSRAVMMGNEARFGKKRSVRQKRWLFSKLIKKTFRWKVCDKQDDRFCAVRIKVDVKDHKMDRYLENVYTTNSIMMKTRKGSRKASFEQALIGTCLKQ